MGAGLYAESLKITDHEDRITIDGIDHTIKPETSDVVHGST